MKFQIYIPILLLFLSVNLFSLDLKWVDEGILVDRDRDEGLASYNKKDYRRAIIHMQKLLEYAKERQNIASAMLVVAESRVRMGSVGTAVLIYRDLVDNYPKYIPFLEINVDTHHLREPEWRGLKSFGAKPLARRMAR